MGKFSLFSYLDPAIIADESSTVRASKTPAVWPSEASAVRTDKSLYQIYGACLRKQIYRMIGWPKEQETQAASPWKWVIGRAIEDQLTGLAKFQSESAGIQHIYAANGVRLFISDFYLPLEIDLIVKEPVTNRGWVVECKSYDGYYAEKQIQKEDKPKDENLIQACIYLVETKTGAKLKELIKESAVERQKLDAINDDRAAKGEKVYEHRNRTEMNAAMVDQISDDPIGCKLVYISRGDLTRTEFDVEIMEDFDGFHYPVVNGMPYKVFTIESIYERFRTGQNHWFKMRQAAVDQLQAKGVFPPEHVSLILSRGDIAAPMTEKANLTKKQYAEESAYYEQLEAAVRALPESYFPPPEYEWSYSPERIEDLFAGSMIPKGKYQDYKKGKIQRLGDWQCGYCPYAKKGCIAKQRPDLVYMTYDLANIPEESEVSIG